SKRNSGSPTRTSGSRTSAAAKDNSTFSQEAEEFRDEDLEDDGDLEEAIVDETV
ncbi:unnamed protein product, partial [Amoebophrya sp. A25]